MSLLISKFFLTITFNICLFLFLIIGIQNSSNKSSVDFLIDKTIELPISFIVGLSFISGSIIGSLININLTNSKKLKS